MSYGNNNSAGNLAWYSMNLLRGQLVSQMFSAQPPGGISLNEFMLGGARKTERRSGTNMMNDALTGLIRSDAGMLKQASKNVREGQNILKQGAAALSSIAANLTRMQEIAEAFGSSDTTQQGILKAEYDSLAQSIEGIIKGTNYNGMSLLDGSRWTNDERMTVTSNYTGTFSIQAGNAPINLTLYDLKEYKNIPTISTANSTAAASKISTVLGQIAGIQQSYEARAGLLSTEAASLNRQADILTEAAKRSQPNNEESFKSALLELLLSDQGKFFETNS